MPTTPIERLTPPAAGAATRLHYDADSGCLWLDTDGGVQDGLVIGIGDTRAEAIDDATHELCERLAELLWARRVK